MLWSIDIYQNKVSADQYHMFILRAQVQSSLRSHVFLRRTADQMLVFRLTCCKQRRVVWKWVDANPRLKINQIKFFLYTNVFHCFYFVYFEIIQTHNRRTNNIQKTSSKVTKIKSNFCLS